MNLTVIICVHNPRRDYFARALAALSAQTLSQEQWELLVVDNASTPSLPADLINSIGLRPRLVREEKLGLTPARLRGIRESRSEVIVFVDDDNVLEPDYLETVLSIARKRPDVGAWGASVRGEFEAPPPENIKPYLAGLAICEIEKDHISNKTVWSLAVPFGAGLCVRRRVAEFYEKQTARHSLRLALDRAGQNLGSGGDMDIAFCAADEGLHYGRFCSLRLTHLIPRERLTWEYILRLYTGFAYSDQILATLRGGWVRRWQVRWIVPLKFWIQYYFRASANHRVVLDAMWKSKRAAVEYLAK